MDAKEFLKIKGVSLHSVNATRLPHKYKNVELELIPLMEEYAELRLSDVVWLSEQLKAFAEHYNQIHMDQLNITTGVFIINGNKITFQTAAYIEDGWYVEMTDDDIVRWEIPFGGGEPKRIGGYYDLISAIKAGVDLY